MEKRQYGKTGIALSVVGFGGILVTDETPSGAAEIVAEAVDRGVNYFDVAPSYGNAEERLGPALEPYRKGVFLACKTEARTGPEAEASLSASLRRLKTDWFDLFQFHAVTTPEDVQKILAPGGALEKVLAARARGQVRYIGFSAHSSEAALSLLASYSFDSVLFPINWASWLGAGFGPELVDACGRSGIPVLALKSLARRSLAPGEERPWAKAWYAPVDSYEDASLGLRFTLSRPGVVAAPSPGHKELFRWACQAAEELRPLSDAELNDLKERAGAITPVFPIQK